MKKNEKNKNKKRGDEVKFKKPLSSFSSENISSGSSVQTEPSAKQSPPVVTRQVVKLTACERFSLFEKLVESDTQQVFIEFASNLTVRYPIPLDLQSLKYDPDKNFWLSSKTLVDTITQVINEIAANLATTTISMPNIETYFKSTIQNTLSILFDTIASSRLDSLLEQNIPLVTDTATLITFYRLRQNISSFVSKDYLKKQINELARIKSDTEIFTLQVENYSQIQRHLNDLNDSIATQLDLLTTFDPVFQKCERGKCYSFIASLTDEQVNGWRSKLASLPETDASASVALRQVSFILDRVDHIRRVLNSGDYVKSVFLSLSSVELFADHESLGLFVQPFDLSVEAYEKTLKTLSDNSIFGERQYFSVLDSELTISQLDVLCDDMPDIFGVYMTKTSSDLFNLFFPINLTLVKCMLNPKPVVYDKASYVDKCEPLINENGTSLTGYTTKEDLIALLTNTAEQTDTFANGDTLPEDFLFIKTLTPNPKPKFDDFTGSIVASKINKLSAHEE